MLEMDQPYHQVISGPMFSGKTREMHRLYKIFKVCGYKVQVFKPATDVRYSLTNIMTHDGIVFDKQDVFIAKDSKDIDKQIRKGIHIIMIDEAMFFDSKIVDRIDKWVESGKIVITTLLPTDYKGDMFGASGELLAKADFITSLSARCMYKYKDGSLCHKLATRTMRKIPVKKQILLGGLESYEPRCRKHHKGE